MTNIRRIAPKICPRCKAENSLFIADDRLLTCQLCGHKGDAMIDVEENAQSPQEDLRSRYPVSYGTPLTAQVDRWAETKFHSGIDYVRREMWDEAMNSFRQALDQQSDFLDAHLWIARLSQDPDEKRNHYGEVLANVSNHLEATRELMILNGQLSREEADRSMSGNEQIIVEAGVAVKAEIIELDCENCGGSLEVPAGQSEVHCQFCGHVQKLAQNRDLGLQSLTMAMLKERGQAVKWRVGKHLLHCDNCSAERVISSNKMTVECPFCGSDQVIKTDALQSFRQPDGIIPFEINRQEAEIALDKALNSALEKFKGLFVKNKAEKVRFTPIFLPFWMFDVTAQIIRTRIDKTSKRTFAQAQQSTQRDEFSDSLNNVPYCGVESPPQNITSRLDSYNFESLQAYDPKRLANATAELYSIDFQKASIKVRKEIGELFRFRNGHEPHGDIQILISHLIQQMSFRLILVPVWVATITENDGDTRLGLVHGQRGKALLGKAYKPKS